MPLSFIAPFLILFIGVYLAPLINAVQQSLYSKRNGGGLGFGGNRTVFVGFGNYRSVLGDSAFWTGVERVLLFGLIQVPVMLTVAVVLALLLDSGAARFVGFYRIVFFLPYAVPGVVGAMLWSYLYSPEISPIVSVLKAIGLPSDFLGQHTVLWSMANITTWSWTGFNMLIILAALQAIPRELYEAARMDGASELVVAIRIKLPQVRRALVLSGTLSIIGTIQLFNEPRVLSAVSNNVNSTYTPTLYAFKAAFSDGNFNLGAAASVVLAVIIGVLSILYYRLTNRAAA